MGGEDGVATGGALVCCLASVVAAPDVAVEGDPIVFDAEDRGDFGNGELGPLGSVSREVESKRSLSGLIAWVFCLIPFEARGGEDDFVVSVAIEETTRSAGGGKGESSLLGRFEAEVIAFGSSDGLFFEAPLPRVLTMAVGLNKAQ